MSKIYKGWICPEDEEDRTHLESLGIKLGDYCQDYYGIWNFYDCEVSEEAMKS